MTQKPLHNWLNDEATPADLEELQRMPEFPSYQKIDSFVKRMKVPTHETETGLRQIKERLGEKSSTKVISLSTFIKIAAVLVLLAASYVYISTLPTSVKTQMAQTEGILLPDTSRVVLNENSELTYRPTSWNEERSLSLDGEAYFNVAKGSTFTVTTSEGTVRVLGTQFNVTANDGSLSVTCYEGLVAVTHGNKLVELPAGQSVSLIGDTFEMDQVVVSSPYWINKESNFENARLKHVLQEVESIYDVAIATENIDVNLRFTGSFAHTNLETALQGITLPLNLNYTIENEHAVKIYQETTME